MGKLPHCLTSHPGQLSFLLFVGREMMLRYAAGWLIPLVDKRVGC